MNPNKLVSASFDPGAVTCYKEEVFLNTHMELCHLGYVHVKNWTVAQDLATDCLLNWCMRKAKSNTAPEGKKELIQMLRQSCTAHLEACQRSYTAEQQFIKKLGMETVLYHPVHQEQKERVLHYLHHLPPPEAEVIRLQLAEERDFLEISIALGKPLQTVRLLHDRALYLLRKHFQPGASLLFQYP